MIEVEPLEGLRTMATDRPIMRQDARGYWIVRWYGDDGRRHSSSFGADAKAARIRFANWLADYYASARTRNPTPNAGPITVEDLAGLYLERCEVYYRRPDGTPTGEAANVADALGPFAAAFGSIPVDQLGPAHVKAYQGILVDRGLARTTINQRTNKLKRWIRWAVAEDLVDATILAGVGAVSSLARGRSGAREAEPRTAVPLAHVEAVLAVAPPTLAAMIQLQLLTGARPGEIRTIRPVDLDTTAEPWLYVPAAHKTAHHGHPRRIRLGPQARSVLEPFLARPIDAYLFTPAEAVKQRRGAAPKRRTHPLYNSRAYRRAIEFACASAGVPAWSPNQLRHTAEQSLERRYGVDAARAVLGHARVETTEYYRQAIDDEQTARIMEEVG